MKHILGIAKNYAIQFIVIFLIMAFAAVCVERKHEISDASSNVSEDYVLETAKNNISENAVPASAEKYTSSTIQLTKADEEFLVQMRKYAMWIALLILLWITFND